MVFPSNTSQDQSIVTLLALGRAYQVAHVDVGVRKLRCKRWFLLVISHRTASFLKESEVELVSFWGRYPGSRTASVNALVIGADYGGFVENLLIFAEEKELSAWGRNTTTVSLVGSV